MSETASSAANRPRARTFAWLIVAMIALPPVLIPRAGGRELLWWHGEVVSALLLALAFGAGARSQMLRTLRPFIIVWIAYLLCSVAVFGLLDAIEYIAWTERTPKYRWATISALLIVLPTLVMLGAARALGYGRSELNLAPGDMRARGRVPWRLHDASWMRIGLCSVAVTVAGGVVWVWSVARDTGFGLLLTWLPVGVVFAALNAAQEEIRFRLVPIAALVNAVGSEQAVWMTATVFGLAHWTGATPAGPLGTIFHASVGAWLAKSILETRGVAWAWIIHAAGNLALFVVLVLNAS